MMSEASAAEQATPAAIAVDGGEHRLVEPDDRPDHPVGAVHRLDAGARGASRSDAMSAPALKPAPVPVITTTRTSSRARAPSSAVGQRDHHRRRRRALRTSGRLKVSQSTPSSSATCQVVSQRTPRRPASRRAPPPSTPARRRRTGRRSTRVAKPGRRPRPARSPARSSRWRSRTRRRRSPRARAASRPAPTPSTVRPSKPEYAAACSPLRKIASNGCGSRLGWNASPSVPTRQCTGQESAKSGSRDQCAPGSTWWSLVATTWS